MNLHGPPWVSRVLSDAELTIAGGQVIQLPIFWVNDPWSDAIHGT